MSETQDVADGYLRFPSIAAGNLAFVSEDDLWVVPTSGGVARRLSAIGGEVRSAQLSPDGSWLAYSATHEADPDVYCMASQGGLARRLTWGAHPASVRAWSPEGEICFLSSAEEPFSTLSWAWAVRPDGGSPRRLPFGPTGTVSFGPDGAVVLGRKCSDPARWKRYRGGTAGELWWRQCDSEPFRRLLSDLDTNIGSPMWAASRIWFLSDHEGCGNLYSVNPEGGDLRRHTDHSEYYARWASTDGQSIVYSHAGRIWSYDIAAESSAPIPIRLASQRPQRQRKFVDAAANLGSACIHPAGHSLLVEARGKLFSMPLFERAARQHGRPDGVRYRASAWLGNGDRLLTLSDEGGEDHIEIIPLDGGEAESMSAPGISGLVEMVPSPDGKLCAIATLSHELLVLDLETKEHRRVDASEHGEISDLVWSPDSSWLAYSFATGRRTAGIRIARLEDGATATVTAGDMVDFQPCFDPEGAWLAFLSARSFDPVPDAVYFDYGFPMGTKAYLVTLAARSPSPLAAEPRGMGEAQGGPKAEKGTDPGGEAKEGEAPEGPPPLKVDLAGIDRRILEVAVPEARYRQLEAIPGKLLLVSEEVKGTLGRSWSDEASGGGALECYDFAEARHEVLADGVSAITLSADHSTVVAHFGERLRAMAAGSKPPEDDHDGPGRQSGWIDLDRIRVSVDPPSEWRQMLAEAWRLQRDHFWVQDFSGIDWGSVADRYMPLVDLVGTRAEFSDLVWEMQGELGTSHAYEFGGDYREPPAWQVGRLAADVRLQSPDSKDPAAPARWIVSKVVQGDPWDSERSSPLAAAGVEVEEGDAILAVGGLPPTEEMPPSALLVNRAGIEVDLRIQTPSGETREVVVKTLRDDRPARYAEWVARQREWVHRASGGLLGYLHVPDMGPLGFSEFHRSYLAESAKDGLIVDVRHNGGGSVSSLLLAKLAARRLGWDVSRWGPPIPYPPESPGGPLVALSDEWAGSDGDIFTHAFRLLKLGPVVGTRTWGGVIGIEPKHRLVDGSLTTQPEFSFWFEDVGWSVENRGVEPDHEVVIAPEDWEAGNDPQMELAISLAMAAVRAASPAKPDIAQRPNLAPSNLSDRAGR